MTIKDRTRLERLLHWQGETVLADDLNDQQVFEAQLRWWHNRMHGAFGVSVGLVVREVTGADGEGRFSVAPGVAFDCHGRELILPKGRALGPPPFSSDEPDWTLLAVHPAVSEFPPPLRQPLAARSPYAEPELLWRPRRRVTPEDGVPLAQGATVDGVFSLRDDFRPVPVRGFTRPILGSGTTVAGQTGWVPWGEANPFSISHLSGPQGFEVKIDTSAAGFTRTPCYFAWLQGDWLDLPPVLSSFAPARVVGATPCEFTFSIWLIPSAIDFQSFTLNLARRRMSVGWLGIQTERALVRSQEASHGTL